jgi:DNA-binding transcriptional MerR regulator
MLRIGEFAALTRISIRMLRHYDEIGLLKPAIVDQFTSYRYYTLDQLPRLHRILALKELGLSLEQIATLLNEDLPAEQIRGMLRLKQVELQQHIQEEQERLARVEARIRRIEMEGKMPDREAVVKQVPPIRVLSFREITNEVGGQFDLAFGAIGRDGNVKLNGPAMALYYHDSDTAELDTEIALPVPDEYKRDVPIDE